MKTYEKFDGKKTLPSGTILKFGSWYSYKFEVVEDKGETFTIINQTKNYVKTPFEIQKMLYKGAIIINK